MAAKRIYQLAKEFECEEKEIIEFLTGQGIKVGNRLSAVSEDAYSLLKAKFLAPPEPEPVPEPEPIPEPEPVVEKPAPDPQPEQQVEQAPAQGGGKKKKKKNKSLQASGGEQSAEQGANASNSNTTEQSETAAMTTQEVSLEAIEAANKFIEDYNLGMGKKKRKKLKPKLWTQIDAWAVLYGIKVDYPDSSPVKYWQGINKLSTKAFKLVNEFGISHRTPLAEMRETTSPIGQKYEPRKIFTEEENQLFAEQQGLLFITFGHGMGAVNDQLFALKMKAENMKKKYEHMDLVEYVMNPDDELRSKNCAPFMEVAEAIAYNISGIARRFKFFLENKERIALIVKCFFEWLDGYAKLKEQGADVAKLEKYLELEKKFVSLAEFFAFDNLLTGSKKPPLPFDKALTYLINYRDNLDDPDAERNFKYKVRGLINIIYKPKEYVFLYQFAGLEPNVDYRPPEVIAAEAEAAAKAAEQAEQAATAEETTTAEKEKPADDNTSEA